MAAPAKAPTPARRVLPDQLPEPAVLLGVFYDYVVAACTDRPAEVEPSQRRSLGRSLVPNVGVVRWSEQHQCYWFVQPKGFKGPVLVHPDHLAPELRARVLTEEPPSALETSLHVACKAPVPPGSSTEG